MSVVSKARFTLALASATVGCREMRDPFGDGDRLVHHVGDRHDPAREPAALGLLGIHHAPGQDHLHRLRLADGARETLGAAGAGDGAELDLRLTESRVVGGDHDVAHHRKLAAAAQSIARDRRDHRLAECGDAVPRGDEVAAVGIDEVQSAHLRDVGTGREGLLVAGDNDGADLVFRLEAVEHGVELADQRAVQRVQRLGPVQRNQADPAAPVDGDVFIGHRVLPQGAGARVLARRAAAGRAPRGASGPPDNSPLAFLRNRMSSGCSARCAAPRRHNRSRGRAVPPGRRPRNGAESSRAR